MPKFCNSCGTTNNDNITNCINCGAALDDGSYIHLGADNNANSINGIYEPTFGQNGYGQQYGQNYYQPYQTPYYQNYPVPNADFFSAAHNYTRLGRLDNSHQNFSFHRLSGDVFHDK